LFLKETYALLVAGDFERVLLKHNKRRTSDSEQFRKGEKHVREIIKVVRKNQFPFAKPAKTGRKACRLSSSFQFEIPIPP